MKDVYDIRRTGGFCEFEMATETRIHVLQAEAEMDMMKWINFLSQHNGVQDFVFEDENEEVFKKLLLRGRVDVILPLPHHVLHHPTRTASSSASSASSASASALPLHSSHFCLDFPLPLFSSDRVALRDVMTSVQDVKVRPNISNMSSKASDCALTLTVEFLESDGKHRGVKSAYFDRLVGDAAMLFYVEFEGQIASGAASGSGAGVMVCPGVWLLLRLVLLKDDGLAYVGMSDAKCPFMVHDLHCKQCRLSRPCEDPCKAVMAGKTSMDINVFFQLFTAKEPYYFHAVMLNTSSVGCLSAGFHVFGEGCPPVANAVKASAGSANVANESRPDILDPKVWCHTSLSQQSIELMIFL
jgi:hypothetical protein